MFKEFEVVIKEDRLKGQEKVDRTIYNINDKVRQVSANGLDVLKYIPAVHVDLQENVTLEGRSDILFFVDDIKRDKDFVSHRVYYETLGEWVLNYRTKEELLIWTKDIQDAKDVKSENPGEKNCFLFLSLRKSS